MTNKLKHLAKYFCNPENETEFEAVKMAAELGGVGWYKENCYPNELFPYLSIDIAYEDVAIHSSAVVKRKDKIHVLEFFRKLRMTEAEAQALEDDRVVFTCDYNNYEWTKIINAADGYHFRLSEDAKECYLVKGK